MVDISHINMFDLAGVPLERHRNGEHHGPCPFCGGKDRFWVRESDQRWFCRQCSPEGGDAITFVMKAQNVTFPQALEYLRIERQPSQPRPKPAPKPLAVQPSEGVLWDYKWELALSKQHRLIDWLEGRGVNGWCRMHGRLGYTGYDSRLPAWCHNKLAIPWLDDTGNVVAVKIRSMPWEAKAYRSFTGSEYSGLYGVLHGLLPFAVIVETELDRNALCYQLGYSNCVASCPLSGFNEFCAGQIPHGLQTLYVAIDAGGEKLYHDVKQHLPNLRVHCVKCDPYKDFGEAMQAGKLPAWVDELRNGYHAIKGREVGIGEIVK